MKVKSSLVLTEALKLIESGEQSFACAAIIDVETSLRWQHNENITSKATKIFDQFRPVYNRKKTPCGPHPGIQQFAEWWPKNSPDRIIALKAAIEVAKKQND